jgi:hypothetical protein
MPKQPPPTKDIDNLSDEEFDALLAEAKEQLQALRGRFRGLMQLSEKDRKNHPGASLGQLSAPLKALFETLLPNKHDSADVAAQRAKLAASFDAFGDKDQGNDPERLEVELLLRRMRRAKAQQELAEEFVAFGRLLADDALHTGGIVFLVGQNALELARGLVNSIYAPLLAPVYDELRNMTKAARAKLDELRKNKKPE